MEEKETKRMYDVPIEATYHYSKPIFKTIGNGAGKRIMSQTIHLDTKVSVMGETEKSYFVQLTEPIRKHHADDKIWVKKRNIRMPKPPAETSEYWYNNFESREL